MANSTRDTVVLPLENVGFFGQICCHLNIGCRIHAVAIERLSGDAFQFIRTNVKSSADVFRGVFGEDGIFSRNLRQLVCPQKHRFGAYMHDDLICCQLKQVQVFETISALYLMMRVAMVRGSLALRNQYHFFQSFPDFQCHALQRVIKVLRVANVHSHRV